MLNACTRFTCADSGGGAPGARPLSEEREREREREREYVHQEGTATDPVETVLVKFFFLTFFGSH